MLTLTLLVVASFIVSTWMWSWMIADLGLVILGRKVMTGRDPTRTATMVYLARQIYHELRPFYLPAAAVILAHDLVVGKGPLIYLLDTVMIVSWWVCRLDDDERWKRRRATLAEKITRRGARLVPVPVSPTT